MLFIIMCAMRDCFRHLTHGDIRNKLQSEQRSESYSCTKFSLPRPCCFFFFMQSHPDLSLKVTFYNVLDTARPAREEENENFMTSWNVNVSLSMDKICPIKELKITSSIFKVNLL